jgi:sec-independent protein translocase protein TatA
MFDISPVQILIVLVIALLVFGPKRLPEMGKSVGRGIREFKGAIMDDEPSRAPAPPAAAGPPAPVEASAPATAPGPVAAAAAPDDDDTVLEGVVVPGDTPPREPQA